MSITVDTVVEPVGLIRKLDFDMLPKIYLGLSILKVYLVLHLIYRIWESKRSLTIQSANLYEYIHTLFEADTGFPAL